MTDAVAPFMCNGCEEPGYGPRYTCDSGGDHSLDLHTRCALPDDPQFNLSTLVLPLFGYDAFSSFDFLTQPPQQGEARVCDACGEATRGYVYHCFREEEVDLHPCCASLPDRFLHGGRAFDLRRKASRPCVLCADDDDEGRRRRWFWAYSSCSDGEADVDLHVACLKDAARRRWEASYRDPDTGDGMQFENTLRSSMGLDKLGETAGTVASFITAVVFGYPMPSM